MLYIQRLVASVCLIPSVQDASVYIKAGHSDEKVNVSAGGNCAVRKGNERHCLKDVK